MLFSIVELVKTVLVSPDSLRPASWLELIVLFEKLKSEYSAAPRVRLTPSDKLLLKKVLLFPLIISSILECETDGDMVFPDIVLFSPSVPLMPELPLEIVLLEISELLAPFPLTAAYKLILPPIIVLPDMVALSISLPVPKSAL